MRNTSENVPVLPKYWISCSTGVLNYVLQAVLDTGAP